jgi:hypothetical protein
VESWRRTRQDLGVVCGNADAGLRLGRERKEGALNLVAVVEVDVGMAPCSLGDAISLAVEMDVHGGGGDARRRD